MKKLLKGIGYGAGLVVLALALRIGVTAYAQQTAPPYCAGTGAATAGVLTVALPAGCVQNASMVCLWSDNTTTANGIGKCVYSQSGKTLTITSNVSNTDTYSWVLMNPMTIVGPNG